MLKKKSVVQDLIPPPSIYIHIHTLYTYTNTYMLRFSPCGFFGPCRCLIPTPWLTTEFLICAACVCVCVNTHTHPRTLPPALKREKTQTTPLSLLLSKVTPHAKQLLSPHRLAEPPNPRSPRLNEQTAHTWAHMHTLQRACTQMCTLISQYQLNVHTCIRMVLKHLFECMHTLRKKCTCTHACAPMQQCRNFFATKTIANLFWVLCEHRAGCRLTPALLLSRRNYGSRPTLFVHEIRPNPCLTSPVTCTRQSTRS